MFYCQTFSEFGGETQSSAEASCVLERLEREKMKAGGGKWMGRAKRV